jgi:DNA polymerase III subunit delta
LSNDLAVNPEQFRRALAKGPPAPAYFFSGPETGLKKEALDALIALVPEATRALNVQVFHAFEADLTEVLTAARTLPFMAPRRVVVLREIEKMSLTEGRGAMLGDYLATPAPETVFVVTSEDESRARSLAKHEKLWVQVEFRALQGAALEKALREEAARLGLRLTGDGLAALLEATGADLARARNELAKLRAAVGEGGAVDAAAVGRYAAGYEHHRSFDITDAVSRRDLAGSLRLLNAITLKEEDFLGLLGQLGKRLRILWYLAGGDRDVPPEFNLRGSTGRFAADARRFTRDEIERGLEGLRTLDDRVKSTQVPHKLLLERYLIDFLSR